jgi:hypothetical protein
MSRIVIAFLLLAIVGLAILGVLMMDASNQHCPAVGAAGQPSQVPDYIDPHYGKPPSLTGE